MAATALTGEDPQEVFKSPHSIDQILSKELLQLSLRDRNAIDEEIHGVSTLAPRETPELLEKGLHELAEELEKIPDDHPSKAAYLESQRFPNTYVNENDFRLRFVRCELFDAQKAATRMVNFLSVASDLYGPVVLQRPIRVTDLTQEEKRQMLVGNEQMLPFRDRSGRPVYIRVGDFGFNQGPTRSRMKICLYLQYSMSDDVESQRNGVTKLMWVGSNNTTVNGSLMSDWELFSYAKKLAAAIPLRSAAIHCCLPDKPYFHMIRAGYGMVFGANRSRLKFHIGEEVELLYILKTYGIPVELIPVTGTGNIKTTAFKQWVRLRKMLEDMKRIGESDPSVVETPSSKDVVFRAGTSLACHPGNSEFQSIMELKMRDHSTATQVEKTAIIKEIIEAVNHKGGRFLKWDARGYWTVLEDATQIHNKVAASLKYWKGRTVAQRNRQTTRSSTYVFQNQDGKRRKLSHDTSWDSDCSSKSDSCCLISIHRSDM